MQAAYSIERAVAYGSEQALRQALDRQVIAGLDALRAVAVLMVIFYHFEVPLHGEIGPMGVSAFFALSGFLITGILLKEHVRTGTIHLSEFYRRRAFRIFPTFYVCWILNTIFAIAARIPTAWWQAAASFFYLTDYARAIFGDEAIKHMGISWSLAVEEQFYFLWPLVLRTALNRGISASRLAAGIALSVCVYRFVLYFGFGAPVHYLNNAFECRIDALMIGSALAIECRAPKVKSWLLWPLRAPWMVTLPLAGLLGILALGNMPGWIGWRWVLSLSVQPILVAILLLQLAYWGDLKWRFLQHPAIRYVARISYALYLYHALALGFAISMPLAHHKTLLAGLCTFVVALLSHHFVEQPFLRMRERKRLAAH